MVSFLQYGYYFARSLILFRSFYIQCPLALICIVLVAWKLDSPAPSEPDHAAEPTFGKLRRIDFLGSASLALTTVSFLIALDLGGQKYPWNHPIITILFVTSAVSGLLFVLVEAYLAEEPIFPLGLLVHRDVVTAYLVAGLQIGAQFAVSFCSPQSQPHIYR